MKAQRIAAATAFAPLICASSQVFAQVSVGSPYLDRAACTNGDPVDDTTRMANLEIVRAFVTEDLAMGDATAFDRYIAEDVWVVTGLKPGSPSDSRDEYRDIVFSTLGVARDPTTAELDIREALTTVDGRVLIRFLAFADHINDVDGVAGMGRRITTTEIHLFCVQDGMIVENDVGGMNPLMWQMIYRDNIAAAVLPADIQ